MLKPSQDALMLCFTGGDLTELGRNRGIVKELEQQFLRGVGTAEQSDPSGKGRLRVPLVEKPGHLAGNRRENSHARSGMLCGRCDSFQDIDRRRGMSRHGLDHERIL